MLVNIIKHFGLKTDLTFMVSTAPVQQCHMAGTSQVGEWRLD